ncbi:unnamed protein product [Candida verbasci]|uniref:Vanadate resistance protein n=1 Tax=Candida verbasci TaxID=1227364 RepID=A0A9W4TWE5_9ASCO|nr:unnamed protein product [Candida verbasci]
MPLRSLTPDLYGKQTDLPIFNKFKPKKHSSRTLIKRIFYILLVCLISFTIYSRFTYNVQPTIPIETSSEKEETQEQVFKVTESGVEEIINNTENLYKLDNIEFYDLNNYQGNKDGNGDIVLFLMPLRNAEHVLPMAFYNLMNLTYDHSLIDIAFLVSDCSEGDTTLETVFQYSVALQNGTLYDLLRKEEEKERTVEGSNDLYKQYMPKSYMDAVEAAYKDKPHDKNYKSPFRSVTIYKKDFGQVIGQGFSDRHAVKVQGVRRKLMGRARNWLTSSALKPYHSWVYWRDADLELINGDVLQKLMSFDYDVIVPNVWRPLPKFLGDEQPYDLNSWVESQPALDLAKTLDEDDVIVEGYAEYPTWRAHLAYIRDPNGNENEIVDLDGIGGVSILAKAKTFRQGSHFAAFTFENHAETEAYGKMSKKMGYSVGGLPHYVIWHIYEPSEEDLNKISKMERKKRRKNRKKE